MASVSTWVPVSYGALDVRDHPFGGDAYELVVVPVRPGSPLFLYGDGAALWRRLVQSVVEDAELTDSEQEIAQEMEQMGILARDVAHPARVQSIRGPWLESPMHELVYSLLGNVAAAQGIEIVFIKGPVLHVQGLRERAHSGDVDCWVRAADERSLASAMRMWGWSPAFSAFTGTQVLHSLTLRAGEWGSAVDVHTWFPGITLESDDAFALIRSHAERREFAGLQVQTPKPAMHAIISALHDVRPLQGRLPDAEQIANAAETLRRGGDTVPALVREGRAEYALAEPLRTAFPQTNFDAATAQVPRDWAWRLADSPIRVYVEALKLIPLRERPRVLFRILWPTAESLRAGPSGDDQASVPAIRLRRAMRGLRLARIRKERS